jgi:hypothetical protein
VRAQEPVAAAVVVTVPAHRAERVRAWLSVQPGWLVEPAASFGDGQLRGSRLLLLWDEWTLARHSASLRSIAPQPGSTTADPFVLPFAGD